MFFLFFFLLVRAHFLAICQIFAKCLHDANTIGSHQLHANNIQYATTCLWPLSRNNIQYATTIPLIHYVFSFFFSFSASTLFGYQYNIIPIPLIHYVFYNQIKIFNILPFPLIQKYCVQPRNIDLPNVCQMFAKCLHDANTRKHNWIPWITC